MTGTIRTMAKGVWSSRTLPAAFAIVSTTFMSTVANAQAVGGGGGSGLLSVFVQWVVTNIAVGAVALAVLACGALLMLGRASFGIIVTIAIGALIISNYQTIAGLFGIGGGGG